jgi:hypothetical protein
MPSCDFETKSRLSAIKPKPNRTKTAIDRHDRILDKGKLEMSKILRNAILAVVAVSGLAGSAYAQQATINSCTNHGDYWTQCLNGAHGSHDDGRGSDRR